MRTHASRCLASGLCVSRAARSAGAWRTRGRFRTLLAALGAALGLAFLLGGPAAPTASAQAPERTDAFVYALTPFDGEVYQSAFAPPSAPEIFLLADVENVISPRWTQTYFWPLTSRYEVDWLARNDFVDGILEVRQNGSLAAEFAPVAYVVQMDEAAAAAELYTGADAEAAYAEYERRQAEYRDALYQYSQDYQVYREKVDALLAAAQERSVSEAEFPSRPEPVPPFSLFSSAIARGYVVDLPAGVYTIQVRLPDGSILPESSRRMETFAAGREGVSYTVMPEQRWTKPEISRTPGSAIYTLPGASVYLQPFRQVEYNDYAYARLLDPQDGTGRRDRNRWVSYRPIQAAALEAEGTDAPPAADAAGYKVLQLSGSGLGYEVTQLPLDDSERPSFVGYKLSLPDGDTSWGVRLVGSDGTTLPGSERVVRALRPGTAWSLYASSAALLVLGWGAVWLRGQRARRVRIVDENAGAGMEKAGI